MHAHDLADIADGENPHGHMMIDCGPLDEQAARDRADSIFALGVGKKNLHWGPSTRCARIFILIPKGKHQKVLEALSLINSPWFWGSTHRFKET